VLSRPSHLIRKYDQTAYPDAGVRQHAIREAAEIVQAAYREAAGG
jgi:hypothetical protein